MPSFSKKEALAQFLYRSRSFLMQRKIGLLRENEFVVLTYHRIAELPAAESYPFDEELISASPSEFDWQMSFLAANFRPEKLSTLLQMCRENRKIPPGSVAVTFDDGFLDNHTVARPILSKHRVPATFFVTTDFVENNQPIWFEVVAFAFISLPVGSIRHPLCAHAAPARATRDSRLSELSEVMRQLKKASDADRISFVTYLMTLVDRAALDKAWKKYGGAMTWEHVAGLQKDNIEVGSHTVTHPILSKTEGQVMRSELSESKHKLEAAVGQKIGILAYPVGGRAHFSTEVARVAKEVGYDFGVSYVSGANRHTDMDPFFVRRHTVERDMTRERFEAQLCMPDVFT